MPTASLGARARARDEREPSSPLRLATRRSGRKLGLDRLVLPAARWYETARGGVERSRRRGGVYRVPARAPIRAIERSTSAGRSQRRARPSSSTIERSTEVGRRSRLAVPSVDTVHQPQLCSIDRRRSGTVCAPPGRCDRNIPSAQIAKRDAALPLPAGSGMKGTTRRRTLAHALARARAPI